MTTVGDKVKVLICAVAHFELRDPFTLPLVCSKVHATQGESSSVRPPQQPDNTTIPYPWATGNYSPDQCTQ